MSDWRTLFNSPTLPFYFVLLAGYGAGGAAWPPLRAAQLSGLTVPYTGMASAIDAAYPPDINDIHPKNKTIIAKRLTSLVLNGLYNFTRPTRGPTVLNATARYIPSSGSLYVFITFDVGDGDDLVSTQPLRFIAAPGCVTCCRLVNTTRPVLSYVRSGTTVVEHFDSWSVSDQRLTAREQVQPMDPSWMTTQSLTVNFMWTDFVECVLYNDNTLPAIPWQGVVALDAQDSSTALPTMVPAVRSSSSSVSGGGGGGGQSSLSTGTSVRPIGGVSSSSSGGAAVLRMSSSSTGQSPSDPASTGDESSGASPALLAMVIVFLVLSLICSAVFVWQYRMRHGSLCCKNEGAEGGRVGSQGMGDWLENTMGVGKKMQWKRGMTDQDLLKQVASDRYD